MEWWGNRPRYRSRCVGLPPRNSQPVAPWSGWTPRSDAFSTASLRL